jgi:hypothetical protein
MAALAMVSWCDAGGRDATARPTTDGRRRRGAGARENRIMRESRLLVIAALAALAIAIWLAVTASDEPAPADPAVTVASAGFVLADGHDELVVMPRPGGPGRPEIPAT